MNSAAESSSFTNPCDEVIPGGVPVTFFKSYAKSGQLLWIADIAWTTLTPVLKTHGKLDSDLFSCRPNGRSSTVKVDHLVTTGPIGSASSALEIQQLSKYKSPCKTNTSSGVLGFTVPPADFPGLPRVIAPLPPARPARRPRGSPGRTRCGVSALLPLGP